ncbi:MAG TPA: ROK family protein [Candidatus Krumholzibacteria bacterium]|nr:ROK family protein [Candidatus Krumholzibacteria bacterium]
MTQRLAAGIDIGGTNTKLGLVDRAGKIVFREQVDTRTLTTAEAFADAVSARIRESLNGAELIGVGIGAPNGNFFTGSIEHAPNLAWKGIVPMARFFETRTGVRTLLTNDANAAALGEMLFGAARGMRDFIFITLGTGVGSGIVVNGALVCGHDGLAGEIGHVIVEPAGRPCGCGRRGCLEQYASAGGLVATYRERIGDRETPVTAREVAERARAGEPAAVEAFRETGDLLGLTLANSVAYTSPAAIFLFGGLTEAGDVLLDPVRLSFEDNLLNVYRGNVDIRLSGLDGADAAILGAASLIWDGESA